MSWKNVKRVLLSTALLTINWDRSTDALQTPSIFDTNTFELLLKKNCHSATYKQYDARIIRLMQTKLEAISTDVPNFRLVSLEVLPFKCTVTTRPKPQHVKRVPIGTIEVPYVNGGKIIPQKGVQSSLLKVSAQRAEAQCQEERYVPWSTSFISFSTRHIQQLAWQRKQRQ